MTRIDFYIIESASPQAASQFTCRLVEKAYQLNNAIYIHTPDAGTAEQLDDLLWTYREGSFIPHRLHHVQQPADCPVVIGHDHEPEDHHQLMINLGHEIPSFFSRFDRLAEVVAGDEQSKNSARERFRFYRDRGYVLETHNIK